jgi:hypothetical protein
MLNLQSGGKPPFLTCEAADIELYKPPCLAGQEEGLAPAGFSFSSILLSLRCRSFNSPPRVDLREMTTILG